METFDFPFHTPTHTYPKGDGFKFGRGYRFTAAPQLPVQRTFTLHFESIVWFLKDDDTVDKNAEPQINAQRLIDFYERHYWHKAFIYPHPVYGNLRVRFSEENPLEVPKSLKGGNGATDNFQIVLIEQPV